jgi:hypothetical protein
VQINEPKVSSILRICRFRPSVNVISNVYGEVTLTWHLALANGVVPPHPRGLFARFTDTGGDDNRAVRGIHGDAFRGGRDQDQGAHFVVHGHSIEQFFREAG